MVRRSDHDVGSADYRWAPTTKTSKTLTGTLIVSSPTGRRARMSALPPTRYTDRDQAQPACPVRFEWCSAPLLRCLMRCVGATTYLATTDGVVAFWTQDG